VKKIFFFYAYVNSWVNSGVFAYQQKKSIFTIFDYEMIYNMSYTYKKDTFVTLRYTHYTITIISKMDHIYYKNASAYDEM
jgi:hypothetical protein